MRYVQIVCVALLLNSFLFGFDGFYVGGSVGGSIHNGQQSGLANVDFGGSLGFTDDLSSDLFTLDWTGMFYAGLGFHWKWAYASLEAFAHYSNARIKNVFQNNTFLSSGTIATLGDTTQLKIGPWHFGVDLRPGFLLGDQTLVYARVGIDHTKINLQTLSTFFINPSFSLPLTGRKQKWENFLRLGAGIEEHITPKLSFRTDYIYTNYRSIHFEGNAVGDDAGPTVTLSASKKGKHHNHSVLMGLSYYFSRCCYDCAPTCCDLNFCGWYLGASGGGSIMDGKLDATLLNIHQNGATIESHPNTLARHFTKGIGRGVIYGGYGHQFSYNRHALFAALELIAQYSPYTRSRSEFQIINDFLAPGLTATSVTVNKIKIDDWQYGVDLRGGITLNPCSVLYGVIGTAAARLHTTSHSTLTSPSVAGGSLELKVSKHATRAVLRVGGGIEQAFNGPWHLRLDYRFTDYRTLRLQGFVVRGTSSLSIDSKVHPQDHAFTLGLSRYF